MSEFCKELRVTRTSSRISRGTTADEVEFIARHSPRHLGSSIQAPQTGLHKQQQESSLLQPLVMQFSIILQVCINCWESFVFQFAIQKVKDQDI